MTTSMSYRRCRRIDAPSAAGRPKTTSRRNAPQPIAPTGAPTAPGRQAHRREQQGRQHQRPDVGDPLELLPLDAARAPKPDDQPGHGADDRRSVGDRDRDDERPSTSPMAPGSANGLSWCPAPRCRAMRRRTPRQHAEPERGGPEPGDGATPSTAGGRSGTAAGSRRRRGRSRRRSASRRATSRPGGRVRRMASASTTLLSENRSAIASRIQPIALRGCRLGHQRADDGVAAPAPA